MTAYFASRMETMQLMREPAALPVIRLIGTGISGASAIRLISKRELKTVSLPVDNGLTSYLPAGAGEESKCSVIPFTSYCPHIAIKSSPLYDAPFQPSLPKDTFLHLDNSPHSFLSTDDTSFCDGLCSPPASITNTPPHCDESADPLIELMNLDFPDIDCSLSFADILTEDLWDIPDLGPSKEEISEVRADERLNYIRGDRVEKKRNSNRQAAIRYRERKRLKKQGFECMLDRVKNENDRLRAQLLAEYQSVTLLVDIAKGMIST